MAKRSLALLSYEFLFDPSQTWAHVSQFEQTFATFLHSIGLEAEFITSVGSDNKRILYICPMDAMAQAQTGKPAPKAPQEIIQKYTDPQTYKEKK